MRDLHNLIKKIGIRRKYLILLLLRSPFDALRTWMLAGLMKTTFLSLEINDASALAKICIRYGLICALLFFYNGIIWSIYATFAAKTEASLQKRMIDKILNLPFKHISNQFGGEWLTRLNSDIHAAFVIMNAPVNVPHLVVSIINTMVSCLLLLRNNVPMLVITWGFLLPHLYINYKIVLKRMPELKESSQKAISENTSAIEPIITEAETILLYDAKDLLMSRYEESSRKLMKMNMNIHMRHTVSSMILQLFGYGGYYFLLLMGAKQIEKEWLSFSDVVYNFQIRGAIMAGMFMLISCLNNIKTNSVCVRRINQILDK